MFRIGPHTIDPPWLLAPMAGVSEMPFRVIALKMGAGLATTELISAKGIFYKNARTRQYMTFDPEVERPYSLQLFGGDIDSMAHAAREAMDHGADIVDINMGCPMKKVTKTGSGTALMTEPKRAAELVRRMREAVEDKIPITAKMRAGWDHQSINCVELGQALEEAGVAALGLHARTSKQLYSGFADWSLIKKLKDAVTVPVLGNGDVKSVADAHRMVAETGCDGVLIGRGALGNPWIFDALRRGEDYVPTAEQRASLILEHFDAHLDFHELLDDGRPRKRPARAQAVFTFRQQLIWYSRGLRGGAAFRRDAVRLESPDEVRDAVRRFFEGLGDDVVVEESEAEGINYKQAYG
jgi:nifR3 family TIM-barrel protein